jgi:hypothetical protein
MSVIDSNQNFPGSIHKDDNSSRNFTIHHQNIRGITSKIDEFQVVTQHYNFACCFIWHENLLEY